ncbi:thioredoxin family protein [Dyadobacter luticola]|uniref:Thioredoxin family protein n=1 Tax=Dyadobacter luticola TaxID=1979387 RepID=A0A5R9KZ34_9BACT|nr:thioredoxin family protein [Dyadobacter luticola]TLV01355.1 thioredoxin family protein [Dyadobacter luticola]
MKSLFALAVTLTSLFVFARFTVLQPGYQVGEKAMDFSLKNVDGNMVSLSTNQSAKGFILVFTCNTCPVAQAYEQRVMDLDKQFASKGYPVIAINANDAALSPGDNFQAMKKRSSDREYSFPYLTDETQQIAKTYGATHTPTVFVVQRDGADFIVRYIGAIDNNAQDRSQASEKYVANAVNALLENKSIAIPTAKAIGCGIKWKKA